MSTPAGTPPSAASAPNGAPNGAPKPQAGFKATERIEAGPGPGRGPMGGGMVGQKAMTFGPSAKRLVAQMRPERVRAICVSCWAWPASP